jgi:hypothetical protein
MSVLTEKSGAKFSECRTWRYALWRMWDWQGYANNVMFIGLNPSTADERKDDPTIRKCIGFAKRWGYGGIYMLNLFAYRATQPKDMVLTECCPVGPGNDEAFGYYRTHVGLIVAAWGSLETRYRPRVSWQTRIATVVRACGCPLYCLGMNQDGEPKHPLYVPYQSQLQEWSRRT